MIHEGRNRIVRRLLDHVGHPVQRLTRTPIGPVRLGRLRQGTLRELTRDELGILLDAAGSEPHARVAASTWKESVSVRAVRGATQLETDSREHMLDRVAEMVRGVMDANELDVDDFISVIFTATSDLHAEFPAYAARQLGFGEIPLLCARELEIDGSMPRVVRMMAHVETDLPTGRHDPRLPARGRGAAQRPDPGAVGPR